MEFKTNSAFRAEMARLERQMREGSKAGMRLAMEAAEDTAKTIYRWRGEGPQRVIDAKGRVWEYDNTGLARDSITGYAIGPGESTATEGSFPRRDRGTSEVKIDGNYAFTRQHYTDSSLVGQHAAGPDEVKGILTMYPHYGGYLQMWEQDFGGETVTQEALEEIADSGVLKAILEAVIEAYHK